LLVRQSGERRAAAAADADLGDAQAFVGRTRALAAQAMGQN
jgi:hypothetical protein